MAGFPLAAIGAGIGQGVEAIERQRAQQLQQALYALQLKRQQQQDQARASLFGAIQSGNLGNLGSPDLQPLPGSLPGSTMPMAGMGGGDVGPPAYRPASPRFQSGGGSVGGGMRTGGAFHSAGDAWLNQNAPFPTVGRPDPGMGGATLTPPSADELADTSGPGAPSAGGVTPLTGPPKPPDSRAPPAWPGGQAASTGSGGAAATAAFHPLHQEARTAGAAAAQLIPPQVYGRMSVTAMAQQIAKANPGIDPVVGMMAIEEYQKLLAPSEQRQWEMFKLQHDDQFRMALQDRQDSRAKEREEAAGARQQATFAHSDAAADRRAETAGAKVFVDPEGNEHFLTPRQQIPAGWRQQSAAGTTASKGREADVEQEVRRLDADWTEKNPDATDAQKQEQHFKNRTQAERSLATSTTHLRSPAALYLQKYMEAHPNASDEDIKKASGEYRFSQAAATAFGGSSRIAQNIISLNTVADHILRTKQYADALRNGDIPRANQIANAIAKELGQPEVTSFEAGRDIMADEVVRLLTSTGGTEADRLGMQSRLATMFSPQQFAGVFNVFKEFTGARFGALRQQYSQGDKAREAEFSQRFLTPEGRAVFDVISTPMAGMTPAQQGMQPGAAPAAGGGIGEVVQNGWRYDAKTHQPLGPAQGSQ